ncbi:MAG: hypothetical protein AB7L09_21215 [Nitrospira sp.]
MAFNGQVVTAGPRTAAQFATDINEELEELFARAPQWVSAIGGSANAITGSLFPVPLNYSKARVVVFKPAQANTGAVTINWSGLGVVSLRDSGGAELGSGALDPTIWYFTVWDATNSRYMIAGMFAVPGSGYLPLSGGNMTGAVNMQDNQIVRPTIKDYAIKRHAYSSIGGVLTLDFVNGNVAAVLLEEDITSIVISNWPPNNEEATMTIYTTQDSTGGWEVDFDQPNWLWPNNIVPVVSLVADKTDIYVIKSPSQGASVFATIGGQNYGA